MASIFIFCHEYKNPFLRVCLTVIICLSSFSVFSQEKRHNTTVSSTRHLRHVVRPDQTFNSIGEIYGVSGEEVANYNNLEYYEEPVLAKYLAIPLAPRITSEKKPRSNAALMHVSSKVNERNLQTVPPATSVVNQGPATVYNKDTGYNKQPINTSAVTPSQISSSHPAGTKNELAAASKTTSSTLGKNMGEIEVDVAALRPVSKVEKVLFLVKIQIVITLFLVVLIFLYMTIRNKKELFKARLNGSIRKVLINEILADQSFSENINRGFTISEFLKKQLDKKANRQFVIDEIINGRKSIKGKVGENFLKLYLALNLEQDSCNKLKSKNWNDVAKGIQELAIMGQNHKMADIFNEINSKNEYVRMEAQSALVRLSGFGGLWFLNILNYPISEWQQMKLISMLSTSPVSDIPDLHLLLSSPNESLVIFTLKLIGVFQQRTMHNEVVKCLGNKSEAVRFVAIKCLKEINNEYTASVLIRRFETESRRNKIAIVKVIDEIGDKDQTDFLLEVLSLKDDTLKISAAKALSRLGKRGSYLLEEYCSTHGDPYSQIFLHIKSAVQL